MIIDMEIDMKLAETLAASVCCACLLMLAPSAYGHCPAHFWTTEAAGDTTDDPDPEDEREGVGTEPLPPAWYTVASLRKHNNGVERRDQMTGEYIPDESGLHANGHFCEPAPPDAEQARLAPGNRDMDLFVWPVNDDWRNYPYGEAKPRPVQTPDGEQLVLISSTHPHTEVEFAALRGKDWPSGVMACVVPYRHDGRSASWILTFERR